MLQGHREAVVAWSAYFLQDPALMGKDAFPGDIPARAEAIVRARRRKRLAFVTALTRFHKKSVRLQRFPDQRTDFTFVFDDRNFHMRNSVVRPLGEQESEPRRRDPCGIRPR